MVPQFYSRAALLSTFRLVGLTAAVLAGSARADAPKFSEGGFQFAVQYGPGFWGLDQAALSAQVGQALAAAFAGDLKTSHTLSLAASYVILGHASVGVDLTATGWDILSSSRGGAGFLAGTVAWHPLESVFRILGYERRPVSFDLSTSFGLGYGIAGQRLGTDGLVLEWGARFDWFFARFFALGTFVRGVFSRGSNLYLDFNNRDLPGNTITVLNGVGLSFWTVGVAVTFRAGP